MKKIFLGIIVVILLAAGISGGAIYIWQKSNFDTHQNAWKNTISDLLTKNSDLQTQVQELSETPKTELKIIPDLGNVYTTSQLSKNWPTYRNEKIGFEIKYPKNWQTRDAAPDEAGRGEIVFLYNPDHTKDIDSFNPYESGVMISYWHDINDPNAKGGSWIDERNYTSLEDHFTDSHAHKQPFSRFELNGNRAYEVWVGGMENIYGVMLEKDGIYELYFPAVNDLTKLNSNHKEIISTFKIIPKK